MTGYPQKYFKFQGKRRLPRILNIKTSQTLLTEMWSPLLLVKEKEITISRHCVGLKHPFYETQFITVK